jgi:squalene-associated FAD-dependent desaturase
MTEKKVTVVGAGWAGLATAILLRRRGFAVTVVEAAPVPGGRARGLFKQPEQDNGQHLFLGAYRYFWQLFQSIGGNIQASFQRLPLTIQYLDADFFWHSRGLWPFSNIVPCFQNKNIKPWQSFLSLSRLISDARLKKQDLSVAEWLDFLHIPIILQNFLLKPLTLAALNTPPERASARVLQRILRRTFAAPGASDFFIPRQPLQAIFPDLAMRWLKTHGVVYQHDRLLDLEVKSNTLQQLIFKKQGEVKISQAVLALPSLTLASLLKKDLPEIADNLQSLGSESTATCYFSLSYASALRYPIYALWEKQDVAAQWLFYQEDKGGIKKLAAVSSAPSASSVQDLSQQIKIQLSAFFPQDLQLIASIIEKRATFSCSVNSDALRPATNTPVAGLYLAGDVVATGLPATIESAIQSAFLAADALCRQHFHH